MFGSGSGSDFIPKDSAIPEDFAIPGGGSETGWRL
jgi:hypothetical protein